MEDLENQESPECPYCGGQTFIGEEDGLYHCTICLHY